MDWTFSGLSVDADVRPNREEGICRAFQQVWCDADGEARVIESYTIIATSSTRCILFSFEKAHVAGPPYMIEARYLPHPARIARFFRVTDIAMRRTPPPAEH